MTDPGATAVNSLFDKMTTAPSSVSYNDDQVRAIIELVVPGIISRASGGRYKAKATADAKGWTIRVNK